jgi:hypothetical protein
MQYFFSSILRPQRSRLPLLPFLRSGPRNEIIPP